MSTYSNAVADEFRRILKDHGLSVCGAARALRVSRQAFHNYLNGTSVPRQKTLSRAMDLWDFKIQIGEVILNKSSFREESSVEIAEQLSFWQTWESIKQQDVKIEVKRVGSSLKFEVNIDIPA